MQAELQMPERSDAVVHLRVGDVIEDSRVSAKHFLCSWVAINAINGTNIFARARYYTYPLSHWEYVAEEFHSMGIHNVTIIAGSHKNGTESKSCAYVHKVKQYFAREFRTTLRIGQHPDRDFILAMSAKAFAPSGGSYSAFIGQGVRLMGGRVIANKSHSKPCRRWCLNACVNAAWNTSRSNETKAQTSCILGNTGISIRCR